MEETNLTKPQIRALCNKIELMRVAMYDLLCLVEEQDSGATPEFCDRYPFANSFDELCLAVSNWQAKLESIANFAGEENEEFDEEFDFIGLGEVVKEIRHLRLVPNDET